MKTVTAQEIAQRAAVNAGSSLEEGTALFDAAVDVMREELMRGNRVVLPNLLSLQLSPSGILETQLTDSGQPMVIPAQRQVAVEIEPELRAAVQAEGRFKILLVVPMKDMFTNIIAQRLEGPKTNVTIGEGAARSVMLLDEIRPDLVVVDGNIQELDELLREVKFEITRGVMASIVIFPEGVDPNHVGGIRVCEDESIQEPFDVGDLVSLAESELSRVAEERNFFQQEIHFQFQTSEEWIEKANDLVGRLIDQAAMDEEKAAALAVAFREAVDNAARHGNKNQEQKLIDAIYLLDKQKVTITVEDEGEGFDTELYLTRGIQGNAVAAARERNQAGRVGGLGIMLMLKCLDDLEYNYVGNLVKLTKYR
jgi:anti-sigma regulatory factor (Ser/Thr protein kinase)/nucleoid DNA-binding protein